MIRAHKSDAMATKLNKYIKKRGVYFKLEECLKVNTGRGK